MVAYVYKEESFDATFIRGYCSSKTLGLIGLKKEKKTCGCCANVRAKQS